MLLARIELAARPYQGRVLPLYYRSDVGAGEGVRTLDIYLGKVVLYQLSYARNVWLPELGSNQRPAD